MSGQGGRFAPPATVNEDALDGIDVARIEQALASEPAQRACETLRRVASSDAGAARLAGAVRRWLSEAPD